jgi:hypothetical protein
MESALGPLRDPGREAAPPDPLFVVRAYCPGCEPFADVLRELLEVRWCEAHMPPRDGPDDALVRSAAALSGSGEAGGEDNRIWCELVHRRPPRPARGRRGRGARRADP